MSLDDDRLKSSRSSSVSQPHPAERRRPVFADEQSQVAVFVVAAVRKVLALDDLLHDVIGIDSSVVHAARLALHAVLLSPGRSVGQGGYRGGRRPLWFGGCGLLGSLCGRGRGRLRGGGGGGVGQAAGGAAAGGGVSMVTEVGEAGAARVGRAVT